MALDFVLFSQIIQVAANRLWAYRKMFNQFFCAYIPLLANKIDYRVMALCLLHVNSPELPDVRRLGVIFTLMMGIPKRHQQSNH